MIHDRLGQIDTDRLAAQASDLMTPVVTASAALVVGAVLSRTPLKWLLAFAGGFVAGQAMRSGSWQFAAVRRGHEPEWVSNPKPGADGKLAEDTLVQAASEDSFPASDPPSYTTGRGND
jgi:hypothetical protein